MELGDDLLSGSGYYRYEEVGGKVAMADPFIMEFIEDFRQMRGIVPRKIFKHVNMIKLLIIQKYKGID